MSPFVFYDGPTVDPNPDRALFNPFPKGRIGMLEDNERLIREFWRLNNVRGFASAASMMASTATIDWVLTPERIPSSQDWQAIKEHYPRTCRMAVKQVISEGTSCVTIADVQNDTHTETPISFFTIECERITKRSSIDPKTPAGRRLARSMDNATGQWRGSPMTRTLQGPMNEILIEAERLAAPAIAFCEARSFPLGAAMIRHHWQEGPAQPVIKARAAYQNTDGGFAHELEVDTKSPASNPFAARLAMQVLLSMKEDTSGDLHNRLGGWLQANQNADGDWHFAAEIHDSPLPFWFAGWEFPSLNPAGCLVGLSSRLDLASPEMLRRTATLFETLFEQRASLEEAENGQFYGVLPYVEYAPCLPAAKADAYLAAIANGVISTAERHGYDDASHFFDNVLPGGNVLAARIPVRLIEEQSRRLIGEVLPDGGWPTPYYQNWRPYATMHAMTVLACLRDGV